MMVYDSVLLISTICWTLTLGQVIYCPGIPENITCTTGEPVIWDGDLLNGQCPLNSPLPNSITLVDLTAGNISDSLSCGQFTSIISNVEAVSVPFPETIVTSSLIFIVNTSFNGSVIRCRTSGSASSVVDIELIVPDIPTPTLALNQDTLTAVTVNLNVDDSRCASLYIVEITQPDSLPIIRSNSTPVISVAGLDLCRNHYSVAGHVEAPNGAQGSKSLPLAIPPGVEGVVVVRVTEPLGLEWTRLSDSSRPGCITGYIISWNGGQEETTGTSNSVNVTSLVGFPYCQTTIVTVTPNTPLGNVTALANSTRARFQHPDFTAPVVLDTFFSLQSGDLVININWQTISTEAVPIRTYGFVEAGVDNCIFLFNTTNNSATQPVSGAQPGDEYNVCIGFINNECRETTIVNNITVPERLITNPQTASAEEDTGFSVTVTLPSFPPMSPSTLSILSTLDPPDAVPILADYPTSSQQYTVTFSGLTPERMYTYDIRIVLRSDSTRTFGLPVTGSYTFRAPAMCGEGCKIGISVSVCFVLLIAITIILTPVLVYKSKTKESSGKSKNAEKHGLTKSSSPPPSDSLYSDPKTIEHQTTATGEEYAMVEKKKQKPTQPEGLYQDPNAIDHKAAPSGEMYAVVDKPKRGSSKKREPDVVPPGNAGLTYADIDVSANRNKPRARQQPAQHPGHVEYADIHPGSEHARL